MNESNLNEILIQIFQCICFVFIFMLHFEIKVILTNDIAFTFIFVIFWL